MEKSKEEWCENCHELWEAAQEDVSRLSHRVRVLEEEIRVLKRQQQLSDKPEGSSPEQREVDIPRCDGGPGFVDLVQEVRRYGGMSTIAGAKAVVKGGNTIVAPTIEDAVELRAFIVRWLRRR